MDNYLRALGFTLKDNWDTLSNLANDIIKDPDESFTLGTNAETTEIQLIKNYDEFSLMIYGYMDEHENISIEHIRPYIQPRGKMKVKYAKGEFIHNMALMAVEEKNSGNHFIFKLQKDLAYLHQKTFPDDIKKVAFGGLSLQGTILLPVASEDANGLEQKNSPQLDQSLFRFSRTGASSMYEDSANGSPLTEAIIGRLKNEDFFTVIESFFLPSDEAEMTYTLLGDITQVLSIQNTYTKEEFYQLTLLVTDTCLDIFIHKEDLVGYPLPGMRFFGCCQLRGDIFQ